MARTFCNAKVVSAFIANEISAVVTRKGFATAAQGTVRNGAPTVMLKKVSEESSKSAWIPDPVTGHYRPENQVKEMDPAELREMLINNKNKGQ
ncbi:late embryogenesis abundant protein lea5 [Phtheirospermum japonicum]|uniref:Late embryogenesis abundant protein lea5 n=1 Tax=Phtheirospermum japonicum TaxID=374723 RepID=A0A830D6H8_9LAMI|nr:late embryogenesis abundant protein lea5 [Phtheirospermum japonicum]